MRCLSIRNPWAWAICLGEDNVENRTWSTDYRGTIAIHTSTNESVVKSAQKGRKGFKFPTNLFQYGAIIGLADIEDVIEYGPRVENNPWASGPYCWLLKNGRFLDTAIPLKGQLTLFSLPDDAAEAVQSQATHQLDANDATLRACLEVIRPPLEPVSHYLQLVTELLANGDLAGINRACDSCLRIDPHSANAHFFKGLVAESSEDSETAFERYSTAIQHDSKLVAAYLHRGNIYFDLGDLEGAWNDYEQAIQINPGLGTSYIGRASVHRARGEEAQAIAACSQAIELGSEDIDALLIRSEAYLEMGELDKAIADATETLALEPLLVDALLIRSRAYEAKGENSLAKRDLKDAETIERQDQS